MRSFRFASGYWNLGVDEAVWADLRRVVCPRSREGRRREQTTSVMGKVSEREETDYVTKKTITILLTK